MSSVKKKWNKSVKKIRKALGISEKGLLSGGTLAQEKAAKEAEELLEQQIAEMEAQYAKMDVESIEAKERKKQIELLKKRRRRAGTILTSPLGLTEEPTTTRPTLLGGS